VLSVLMIFNALRML